LTEIEKNLATLAEQINAEHRACDDALRSGLQHAVNAGGLLTEAKERVNHGEWGSWLADNFEGSTRTAHIHPAPQHLVLTRMHPAGGKRLSGPQREDPFRIVDAYFGEQPLQHHLCGTAC